MPTQPNQHPPCGGSGADRSFQEPFHGGVAVHVHGADASLLQAIEKQCPNLLGQLLVADEKDAGAARETLVAAGLHGKISVGKWKSGTLPFVDNFVNLLIIEQGVAVAKEEILRVLAPEGTAFIGGEMLVKPRPSTMDDWTHQLYDATGNAVSKDKALKPPLAHLQWVGGPGGRAIMTKCPASRRASAATARCSTSTMKATSSRPTCPATGNSSPAMPSTESRCGAIRSSIGSAISTA